MVGHNETLLVLGAVCRLHRRPDQEREVTNPRLALDMTDSALCMGRCGSGYGAGVMGGYYGRIWAGTHCVPTRAQPPLPFRSVTAHVPESLGTCWSHRGEAACSEGEGEGEGEGEAEAEAGSW